MAGKLLGFDNRWGRWEIDHCNGRAGESAAGDLFKSELKRHSNDIMKKLAGELPSLPAQAIKAFKTEFLRELKSEVEKLVREAARAKAKDIVKDIINDVIDKNEIKVNKMDNERMEDIARALGLGF